MKKYRKLIIICLILLVTINVNSYAMANNSKNENVNNVLVKLLNIKNDFIDKGKNVPDNIQEKIELETAYTEEMKQNTEKCKKDIEVIEEKKKTDPNYGVLDIKSGNEPRPTDSICITNNPELSKVMTVFGTIFGEETICNMDVTNMVGTEYNIILAGCDKDNTTGILLNIIYDNDSFDINSVKLTYPDSGKITFTKIDEKKNVVEFTYGKDSIGYFDLDKNEAIFK